VAWRDLTGAVAFDRLEASAGGDVGVIEEVLALFDEQVAVWMRLLEGDDPQAARDAAHTLKGAALGLGADALAAACTAMEGEGDDALLPRRAQQVRDALDAAGVDIAAYRHELMLRSLRRGG
jgi:HPt (histidine-containing phosphotransfer) domain-containing protein